MAKHPPALVLEAALAACDLQLGLRKARLDSLFWVKGSERFAEDFIGGIAFNPLGSLVPAHNAALEIEHEEGVILDAPNQQLETLFAPEQFFPPTLIDRPAIHAGEPLRCRFRTELITTAKKPHAGPTLSTAKGR